MLGVFSSQFYPLIALHLVLALAPIASSLVPPEMRMLPILWAVSTIPIAQMLLLAVFTGMPEGKVARRVGIALAAMLYVCFWPAVGQYLMTPENLRQSMLSVYWQHAGGMLMFWGILVAVMLGAKRLMGVIGYPDGVTFHSAESRTQYSVFALLASTTVVAIILGLSRGSQSGVEEIAAITSFLLGVVVFVANVLTTVWATLGRGHVGRRLAGVFGIAVLLGMTLAVASGNSLDSSPWWLFISMSLIIVFLTAIVACTLLVIRVLGFRLIPIEKRGYRS